MCVLGEGGKLAFNNLNIRHNIKIKIYTLNITINANQFLAQYQKLRPLVKHASWKCTPYGSFLFIFNFTSLTLVLRIFNYTSLTLVLRRGGCNNHQNSFRPGAQKHAAKG